MGEAAVALVERAEPLELAVGDVEELVADDHPGGRLQVLGMTSAETTRVAATRSRPASRCALDDPALRPGLDGDQRAAVQVQPVGKGGRAGDAPDAPAGHIDGGDAAAQRDVERASVVGEGDAVGAGQGAVGEPALELAVADDEDRAARLSERLDVAARVDDQVIEEAFLLGADEVPEKELARDEVVLPDSRLTVPVRIACLSSAC
jgi:hypothetical protein